MFREFLKDKLITERVSVEVATNRDAYMKLLSSLPDLVILNLEKVGDENPVNENLQDFFQLQNILRDLYKNQLYFLKNCLNCAKRKARISCDTDVALITSL